MVIDRDFTLLKKYKIKVFTFYLSYLKEIEKK